MPGKMGKAPKTVKPKLYGPGKPDRPKKPRPKNNKPEGGGRNKPGDGMMYKGGSPDFNEATGGRKNLPTLRPLV